MLPFTKFYFALPLPHVLGFPKLGVLSASPTSIIASAFLWFVPFSLHTQAFTQDHNGSPRFHSASISTRAMLSDPAEVSNNLSPYYRLSTIAFQVFDPVGPRSIFTRLNNFTCVTARVSLCLRLVNVVTFINPRLDLWWRASPCQNGNFTH